MTKRDCVIQDLYTTLERIRYPEVAHIQLNEFETTILNGPQRMELLHWILMQSPNFVNTSINKARDNLDNSFNGKLMILKKKKKK